MQHAEPGGILKGGTTVNPLLNNIVPSLVLSVLCCPVSDPPLPDGSPNITSVSHNSVKVKFSGFEASHGPIKAYALVLTTVDGKQGS